MSPFAWIGAAAQEPVRGADQVGDAFLLRRAPSAGGVAAKKQHRKRPAGQSQVTAQQLGRAVQPLGVAAAVGAVGYVGVAGVLKGYRDLRRRNLRHLIRTVAPALDSLGATYWLDFGSLLGAHREKDVIAHDNDADICVLNPDWDALLAGLRAALPQLRVFFVVPSEDRSIKWIRVLHGVGVMDVYGAFDGAAAEAAGSLPGMISIPQGHGDLCDVPSSLVFPLGALTFHGVAVSAPGDVHGVLSFRYGADYMVPKYMDKGRDTIEQGKLYARLLGLLGKAGLRV